MKVPGSLSGKIFHELKMENRVKWECFKKENKGLTYYEVMHGNRKTGRVEEISDRRKAGRENIWLTGEKFLK